METEIEVKFCDINIDEMRSKLKSAGAICEIPMRLMRRVTFDSEFMQDGKDGFLRVRDEGDKVTMTYKQFDDSSLSGTKEIEVVVSNFDDAVAILASSGLSDTSTQESRRETWKLDDVEVVIDEWPWIEPYIEIEGGSEQAVESVANKLGFDMNDGVFGGVDKVYKQKYDMLNGVRGVIDIKAARFGDPIPKEFAEKN